jgi:hypothetical protein
VTENFSHVSSLLLTLKDLLLFRYFLLTVWNHAETSAYEFKAADPVELFPVNKIEKREDTNPLPHAVEFSTTMVETTTLVLVVVLSTTVLESSYIIYVLYSIFLGSHIL